MDLMLWWIMDSNRHRMRLLAFSLLASMLLHLLILSSFGRFGSYNFTTPVTQAPLVDMKSLILPEVVGQTTVRDHDVAPASAGESQNTRGEGKMCATASGGGEAGNAAVKTEGQSLSSSKPLVAAALHEAMDEAATGGGDVVSSPASGETSTPLPALVVTPPLRAAGEFLTTKSEKLSYQISLLSIPVGSAELEAKNENGEVRITLRTKSNAALSNIYAVDDIIETRHIGGNFILTKIRQQEGAFRSDIGFTIFLRDKSVFWIDLIKNGSTRETIPNSEVLDILSGLYYLRNRPLQVGTSEMLHIYDSDTYSAVPVEVLRREEISLPGFRKADTLVVKPLLQTEGIFRTTGEVLIWLTNDENRVPVKVETVITLGKVTAELISAETKQ